MTAYPECHLARELELCYADIAMVTDYDVGVEGAARRLEHGRSSRVFDGEPRAAPRAPASP